MSIHFRQHTLATATLMFAALGAAHATVAPNALFSDNSVLQRQLAVPVWGTADPNEAISVSLNGQTVKTKAGADGNWIVRLKPMMAGGPYTMTIAGASNTVTVNNVLLGDVWVCSGQSNMEFRLAQAATGKDAIQNSKDPLLHFWIVPHSPAVSPQTAVKGQWLEADPATIARLTAVGYFFGRDLRQSQQIPIGLIETSWGGTVAEAWTSRPTLESNTDLKSMVDDEQRAISTYADRLKSFNDQLPTLQEKYAEVKTKYDTDAAAAKAAGQPVPTAPKPPTAPADPATLPIATHLYNGMIAPILPYGIKGAIWYQGESNAGRAYQYQTLFPAMISDWRKNWGQGDFPFYFVQLASFMAITPDPKDSQWAELREAQRQTTLKSPNTAMVVITDLGDQKNIHPVRKEPVGDRLALAARALVYKEAIEYTGPVYKATKVEGSKIRVSFTHADGLHTMAVQDADGTEVAPLDKLVGFTIAGDDQKFVNADAVVDGSSVVVSSPSVPNPVAVRYGWANYPVINLQNKSGLLASPFRTDDWPQTTQPKPKTP